MRLSLTVISSEADGLPVGTTRVFEDREIVIGRGAACDWILPDPTNHLSKRHCVIDCTGAECAVTDTSTNGVYLNDDGAPLGSGNRRALANGDRLAIGDYVLEARLLARRLRPAAVDDDDPFGIAEYRLDTDAERRDEAPSVMPGRSSSPSGQDVGDPLRLRGSEGNFPESDRREVTEPEDGDLFEDGFAATREPDWQGAPVPDHVSAERAAFAPPRTEEALIPDDWLEKDEPGPPARPDVRHTGGDGAVIGGVKSAGIPRAGTTDAPLAAFLAGAGLSGDFLAGQDPDDVMRRIGHAYREAVLGVAAILRTRAMMKSEFRIEQTMIGAAANNPLKFLDDPDAILAAMVGRPSPGYKDAAAALREGLRDVQAHELAMLAAMQIALSQLLEQLDPAALAGRLDRRSLLDAVLPAARKAKYWEAFEQSYKAIAGELADDFHGVFGEAFAAAYEKEVRRR